MLHWYLIDEDRNGMSPWNLRANSQASLQQHATLILLNTKIASP
jgi:hypothetical protein